LGLSRRRSEDRYSLQKSVINRVGEVCAFDASQRFANRIEIKQVAWQNFNTQLFQTLGTLVDFVDQGAYFESAFY
jgi:hypothetical protein